MNRNTATRRQLLKRAAMYSVAGSGAAASLGKLGLMNSALAASSANLADYRALVCVFLYGGSDSFNMFVPYQQAEYDVYQRSRGVLAVDRNQLLTGPDTSIGFNPGLPNLRRYYDSGRLAITANVGNLISPVTRQDFLNESAAIPKALFAHDQQQEQWQKSISSRPSGVVNAGWGGRMADLLETYNTSSVLPPQFTINGTNYWSPGNRTQPVSLHPQSGLPLVRYLDSTVYGTNRDREVTLEAILNLSRDHPMQQQATRSYRRARDSSQALDVTLDNSPDFQTPYDDRSNLAQQLRMVARLIAGREQLGFQRQIFFIGMGGYDTHADQVVRLRALLAELDSGLASFQGTIDEMGLGGNVTTFTASDFGRTLTINGDGTDHGWGGHYMVMGDAVRGGQIYGEMPDLETGGVDDAGDNGRVIPKISVNQYGAVLGRWMGLSDSELYDVFPDLSNFNDSWRGDFNFLNA